MQSYRNLDAWKFGLDLVEEIYRLTKMLPQSELYEMPVENVLKLRHGSV